MKLLTRLFSRQEIHNALFALGVLLFCWPLLSDRLNGSLPAIFTFLFVSWILLIVGIALASWAQERQKEE